jgi:hypothetical protein
MKDPEHQGINLVLVGQFNPSIFQPVWFASEDLIRAGEADTAKIEIIHPDLAIININMEGFRIEVTPVRFSISTSQVPYFEVIRDLALGTFRILKHTPISMLGINFLAHYKLDSEEKWHEVGHTLAPKLPWGDALDSPGLRSLTMEESRRRDGQAGHLRVKVEPSTKVNPGIYLDINDHFQKPNDSKTTGSEEIMTILEKSWEASLERSGKIIRTLLEQHL